jgi:peptidoglycan/LPS O-acetylase OafA/YrhL
VTVGAPTGPQPATAGRGDLFPGLDGLRAIAILLVIAWHGAYHINLPVFAMGPFKPLIYVGWAGVDLFFALSGFLITSLLLREEREDAREGGAGRFHLGHFYARRALRILPPFYLVLALNVFVLSSFPVFATARLPRFPPTGLEGFALAGFWSNYFYAYAGLPVPGGALLVYWSLCVEEHFYLLWPFALVLARRRTTRLALGLFVCLAIPLLRAIAAHSGLDTPAVITILSHYRMDSILWGALAALSFDVLAAHPRARRAALLGAGAVTLALCLTGEVGPRMTPLGQSVGLSLLAVTNTLLVVEAATGWRPLVAVLDQAALRSIGRVSYGMYLLHFQAIDIGSRVVLAVSHTPSLPLFAFAYALFALMAYLSALVMYRLVERPFLELRSRFKRVARAAQGASEPAPADAAGLAS